MIIPTADQIILHEKKSVNISPSQLIDFLKEQLNDLPDLRKGTNKKYQINDVVIAAFSVFFTQCPSFLEHQTLMKKRRGVDNAQSLFGLNEIPCDNQIRTLNDSCDCPSFIPCLPPLKSIY